MAFRGALAALDERTRSNLGECFMSKKNDPSELLSAEHRPTQRAILFEIRCYEHRERGTDAELRIQRIAALTLEEVIRYIRVKHPGSEITELKVVDQIEVLSSSEHLG